MWDMGEGMSEEVLESQQGQPPAASKPPHSGMEAGAPHASEHAHVGTPVSFENHCRNCAVALTEGHAFCANCGQKVIVDRLSVRESLLDFWFTMVRPVFALVRALLVRPGYVARDYVEGKRKRFLGPYAFLSLIVGLASAAYLLSGLKVVHSKGMVLGTASPNTETLNALAMGAAGAFFQRHVNIVILLNTPVLAAYSRLLFRKLSFAEHLVLACYTSGMRSLFTTIIVIPSTLIILRLTGTDSLYCEAAGLLLWFAYFTFAMVQFSRDHRMFSSLKGALAAVLAWVTSQIVLSAITMGFVLSRG
jgi:hypothetical protein